MRRSVLALVSGLVLCTGAPAQQALPGHAPADCWSTAGGGAARTYAAATEVGSGPFEQAWEATAAGRYLGQPLVWGDVLLVELEQGPEQRSLLLLDLLTGRERDRQGFASPLPLQPSLYGTVVVVRSGPKALTALRLVAGRIKPLSEVDFDEPVSAPLLVEDRVWFRLGESLAALRVGGRSPAWRVPGRFRGALSLRDERLFAVAYDALGMAVLHVLDPASGDVREVCQIGHHEGRVPDPAADLEVSVHARSVFVSMPLPVPVEGDRTANTAILERGADGLVAKGLLTLVGSVAEEEEGWLGQTIHDGQRLLVEGRGVEGPQPLASATHHPEFLEGTRPVRAGGVALIGRHLVRRHDSRILAHLPVAPESLVVPARGTLLVSTDFGRRLVAFRPRRPGPAVPRCFEAGWATGGGDASFDGRAVLRDGAVWEGRLTFVGGPEREWSRCLLSGRREGRPVNAPLTQVLWVETQAGALRFAGPGDDYRWALDRWKEQEPDTPPAQVVWQRVANLPDSTPWDLRVDLLHAVLAADPRHPEARALVKALVPPEIRLPEDFQAAEWLTFVEAVRHAPIQLVKADTRGPAQERLRQAQADWRRDLIAIQSPNLLVLTPLVEPGRVARCLASGELLCETLAGWFAGDAVRSDRPMTLYLFESEEEYLRHGGADREFLEWSAGHYSVGEGISRLYLPAEADAFARVLPTLVHELTHQWLAERSAPGGRAAALRADAPGFWVVEGFATLMESFTVDLRRRVVSPSPHPAALDLLALAAPEQLLDWSVVLGATQQEFRELGSRPDRLLASSQYLGVGRQLGPAGTYYVQAEALCQYLYHAKDGRLRARLLEAVRRFHSQAGEGVEPQRDLGMSAAALGREVMAFARAWPAER